MTDSAEIVCSVCVANYNGHEVIDDCLRSILAQDCDFAFEIIVHDDASTDDSANYIANRYPQVTLLRSEKNVGFCVSNNRMAERARGRFLLLLNNDATLQTDALFTLFKNTTRQPGPVILTLPQYNAQTGTLVDRGLRLDPFLNPVPNLDPTRLEVSTVHGACLWVPTAVWNAVGGFPDWFHMLAEDLYLCCVARLRGVKVMVTAHSGYRHRIGYSLGGGKLQAGRLDSTLRRRALSERNKNFVMVLCYPLPALALVFPLHATLLCLEGMILAAIRHNPQILTRIYLASFYAIAQHWRTLRGQRRLVQQPRIVRTHRFFSTFTLFPQKLRLLLRHGLPQIR